MTHAELRKKVLATLLAGVLLVLLMVGCTGQIGSGESGEGAEAETGGEEESSTMLLPDATLDQTRAGARLLLDYDGTSNTFIGTVANTTDGTLPRVRIEVHLDTGAELGPTAPVDVAPGNVIAVTLPANREAFAGWTAHAEVGGSAAEERGEHGPGGESVGEHGGGEGGGEGGSVGEHSGGG